MTFDKPSPFKDAFKNHRGYKYLEAMMLNGYEDVLKFYGAYVCREWNNHHPYDAGMLLSRLTIWKLMASYDISSGTRVDYSTSKQQLLSKEC